MVDSQLLFGKKISITNEIDKFIIKKDNTILSLDKQNLSITQLSNEPSMGKSEHVFSIVGILDTRSNSYLLCVNNVDFIGNILTSRVFKITEVRKTLN